MGEALSARRSADADVAGGIDPAEFAEDERRRAKTGERGLDEIEPDETGEEKPARVDIVSEGDAEQGHAAGEDADEGFGFHKIKEGALITV